MASSFPAFANTTDLLGNNATHLYESLTEAELQDLE